MTITDNDQYFQNWPFSVSEEDRQQPEEAERIEFLESVYSDGFEACRDAESQTYYSAKSKLRVGNITLRGVRDRWQIELHEGIERRLTAYIIGFNAAGGAVRAWLNGCSVSEILEGIKESLTNPYKTGNGYTVYDATDEQHWPFPVSEGDSQRPEEIEKIEFLERAYSEGFDVYRVCREEVRYTATSPLGVGHIEKQKRGNCWQLRVSGGGQQLMAFVTEFRVAGAAVRACLNGQSVSDILEDINEYLIIPPKSTCSYRLD